MNDASPNLERPSPAMRDAARFWERGRFLFNAILAAIVLLWIVLSWPHFRPSFTLGSFESMVVLALMANLAYSAAYVAELFLQPFIQSGKRRPFRRTLWILGMLLAILLANYWIADEIYPAADHPPTAIIGIKLRHPDGPRFHQRAEGSRNQVSPGCPTLVALLATGWSAIPEPEEDLSFRRASAANEEKLHLLPHR